MRRRPQASGNPFPLPAPRHDDDETTGEGVGGIEDFHERTGEHLSPWRPLSLEDWGSDPANDPAEDAPLLQSLRTTEATSETEETGHGTNPGKGLN